MAVSFMPSLWYAKDAEAAARFYASVVPDSRIDRVTSIPAETPSGPPGSVTIVELTLAGVPIMAMTAGPHHDFNDAISMMLLCDTQAEIDALWDGLLEGGKAVACGWLTDRFGVRWQIAPRCLGKMMADPDRQSAARVAQAMLGMVKLDISKLEAAKTGP